MWFLWNVRFLVVIGLLGLLILLLLPRLHDDKFITGVARSSPLSILFFLYFGILSAFIGGVQTYLIASFLILLFHRLFTETEKIRALEILSNLLAGIILMSLVPWLVHTFIYKLPMWGGYIQYYDTKGMDSVIENYLLFIQVQHDFLIRFYSIFDEPGTLGTLCAFVLYGNRYDFRRKTNIIILVGAITTFSMAFYALFLLGIFLQNLTQIRRIVIALTSLVVLTIIVYALFKDNETFQTTIINRFTDVDSSVESRESGYLDEFYKGFLQKPERIYGAGRGVMTDNPLLFKGQTYKFFVIEFGLAGVAILLMCYTFLLKKFDLMQVGCLVVFLLSFMQRPFAAQPWQILLFIMIIAELERRRFKQRDDLIV
ncbi:hypothetical protein [Sphingobacterium bambusae]|uniref:O-antigen ligase domain-containing protein n=1 Tax=Sphingobacterium bambusae TaxID=662858 RepID=A0ABW6BDY3_9SPHI|nr:hypothetical protein [Sphingobacterium bambusae]WPL46854.1 hypothetical protein SCB77_12875 [Sphingobacterium bambusae]